jgi:hypothetical protein
LEGDVLQMASSKQFQAKVVGSRLPGPLLSGKAKMFSCLQHILENGESDFACKAWKVCPMSHGLARRAR